MGIQGGNVVDKSDNLIAPSRIQWTSLKASQNYNVEEQLVHEELWGETGNSLRLNQSMSIFNDIAFTFNDGRECRAININSSKPLLTSELPDHSHHNNAQFLDVFIEEDTYPILQLSRGDYPPSQNELYVVRVREVDSIFTFSIIKTIKNEIPAARNNGSWVADTKNNRLFLYGMSKSDWQTVEDNVFCIYEFDLPNLIASSDYTLTMADVRNYWEYKYLIHQGGTYYNGYLFFNVQSLYSINDFSTTDHMNVIAVNADNGKIEAILPLKRSLETEGICVYDQHLYISFKDGSAIQDQNNITFQLFRYTLPEQIFEQRTMLYYQCFI